jgi:hypothetical protein
LKNAFFKIPNGIVLALTPSSVSRFFLNSKIQEKQSEKVNRFDRYDTSSSRAYGWMQR